MQKVWPAESCNVPFQRVTNPGSQGAALGVQRSQVQILSSRLWLIVAIQICITRGMGNVLTKPQARTHIARNLQKAMEAAALSQSELARRANVKQVFIHRLLNSHALPNVADLANIAESLEMTVDELIAKPTRRL